jgi:hypothetical protein
MAITKMDTVPQGYTWVRDVYPNAKWLGGDEGAIDIGNRKLTSNDYVIVNDKAYFNPVTPGNVWTRDLVPNAEWNNNDKSITLPGLGTLPQGQYEGYNGRSYVNPTQIGKMYLDKANAPLTPETYGQYQTMAENIYKPLYEQQTGSFNRLIDTLTNKLNARLSSIDVAGNRARSNLQTQEQANAEKLARASIGRGTYTSGVSDYEQRQLNRDYAPQYGQLESELAAQAAEANAGIGGNLADIAAQAKNLERDYMSQVATGAQNLYTQQLGKDQEAYLNFLKLVGVNDERVAAERQNMLNQASAQNQMFGKVTTPEVATGLGVGLETQTLAGQQQAIEGALARAQQFGRVTTQADADILGTKVGASTFEAQNAAANRDMEWKIASGNMAVQREANASNDTYQNFTKDIQAWELTGKAPDTPALKAYGIQPGTPWTGTPADVVAKAKADEVIKTQQQTYIDKAIMIFQDQLVQTAKLDANTAEAVATLVYNNPRQATGMAIFNSNKEALAADKVNIKKMEEILTNLYTQNRGDLTNTLQLNNLENIFNNPNQTYRVPASVNNKTTTTTPTPSPSRTGIPTPTPAPRP